MCSSNRSSARVIVCRRIFRWCADAKPTAPSPRRGANHRVTCDRYPTRNVSFMCQSAPSVEGCECALLMHAHAFDGGMIVGDACWTARCCVRRERRVQKIG